MRRLAAVPLLLLLAGCGGSSSPAANGDTPSPSPSPSHDRSDVRAAQRVEHYFRSNFQGTSWLPDLQRVKVEAGQTFLVTDLYPDADAAGPARALCGAVAFLPHVDRPVHVVASNGRWIGC